MLTSSQNQKMDTLSKYGAWQWVRAFKIRTIPENLTYSCSKKRLTAQYDYNLISEAAYELYFCYCYQLQAQRIPS